MHLKVLVIHHRLGRRELLELQGPSPRRPRSDHSLDGRRPTISAKGTVCTYPRGSRYDPLLNVLAMLVRIIMYSLCWVSIMMYSLCWVCIMMYLLCWARGPRALCSGYGFDDVVDDGPAIEGRGSSAWRCMPWAHKASTMLSGDVLTIDGT